jgi:hypothetical protein
VENAAVFPFPSTGGETVSSFTLSPRTRRCEPLESMGRRTLCGYSTSNAAHLQTWLSTWLYSPYGAEEDEFTLSCHSERVTVPYLIRAKPRAKVLNVVQAVSLWGREIKAGNDDHTSA